MTQHRHPQSPRLDHCPETLPQAAYLDPAWYARELQTIFARNWISAGRLADLAPGTMRRVQVGTASVILCRGQGWHPVRLSQRLPPSRIRALPPR